MADKEPVADVTPIPDAAAAASVTSGSGGGGAPAAATILTTAEPDKAATEKVAVVETAKADAGIADKGAWPEDWRDRAANGDAAYRKQLDRYASPVDLAKKAKELETKLSSGEYKRDLPKDATEEQVNEWRKERGLPENPEGYLADLKLSDGMVLGEADKPVAAGFAEAALKANISKEAYGSLVEQYYRMQDAKAAERAEQDGNFKQESIAALVDEYGTEFKRTITHVNNLIATWPEGVGDSVLSARGPDGRLLGDNPAFIKVMAQMARDLNPIETMVGGVGSSTKGVQEQLNEIREQRRADPEKYDQDKALQARELELLNIKQKLESRGRAA